MILQGSIGSHIHAHKHTHTHKQVKLLSSDKLNFMYLPLNYVNNVGMTEFTEFSVKQVVNRPCSPPQSPGPSSQWMELLEYTIKGDPRA